MRTGVMFATPGAYLIGFLMLVGYVCDFKSQAPEAAPAASHKASSTTDVCSLLEKSDIASMQGVPVQQTEPSRSSFGELDISQCYYTAIANDGQNFSVHLQLIQRNPKSTKQDALREFWRARFGKREQEDERREQSGERSEEENEDLPGTPTAVAGIGSEAYWLASSRGGALFVRTNDWLVRVSIGGSGDGKAQIEKSKTLAKKALARLKQMFSSGVIAQERVST